MKTLWNDTEAASWVARYGQTHGERLALRAYSSRLLGAERQLVLHGGGNTSVKGSVVNLLGETVPTLFVKGSGHDLATIEPEGHVALELAPLLKLRRLTELDDATMVNELRIRLHNAQAATPSIEALLHAFLPHTYIDHTHADAILALSNRPNGAALLRQALGEEVAILDYVKPGFALAKAVAELHDSRPQWRGMVLMHHGLITWGETARAAYEAMIELVSRAEAWLQQHEGGDGPTVSLDHVQAATARYQELAPKLRGLLALPSNNPDRPQTPLILLPLITPELLALLNDPVGKTIGLTPPLTADHLIRTKPWPLWIDDIEAIPAAVNDYVERYTAYCQRHNGLPQGNDPLPRLLLIPGIGAVCAGRDLREATIARDIAAQTLAVKQRMAAAGVTYQGLSEEHLYDMEFMPQQQAKKAATASAPLRGLVAVITGAAGAIGSGIVRELLDHGCCVAATDLPGAALNTLVADLQPHYGERVIGVPMDVSDPDAVQQAFTTIVMAWGGVDLVVINAGLAHVAPLVGLGLEAFRRLERVNVEGTLLLLAASGRLYAQQGIGGDIVLISTKNVFAPGANFGAYSATKAAAHQLARIAVVEMAGMKVRVNMVSPDAVFSDGARKSGLWAEVGPDRMKARGLDEAGLEAYYQDRNLLKARITSQHVARAVLYFATRQSPTTGATIPVDGGLPDATPR